MQTSAEPGEKKTWNDPHLLRLERLTDGTQNGYITGGAESAPTKYGALFYTS